MTLLARLALAAALLAAPLAGAADARDPRPTVVIGVRTDTRPFAWQAEDNADTYRGFLVDICFDATTRAGYHFETVPIDATRREAVLAGDFVVDGRPIDLLCDPTTITLARLDVLAGLAQPGAAFTPIVFVANGSYVRHASFENRQPCVVGAKAGPGGAEAETRPACATEAAAGAPGARTVVLPKDLDCDKPDASQYFVAGSVVGTTARATVRRAARLGQLNLKPGQALCLAEAPSHEAGVTAFCDNAYHFYFGDLDIIQARRQQRADAGGGCDLAAAERPLSYEPYALLVASSDAAFRARFITMVYEMFSDGSAAGLFDAHFPGHGKSNALGLLFRINSVPGLRAAERPAAPSAAPATATLRTAGAP
jgi:hypothetical protein